MTAHGNTGLVNDFLAGYAGWKSAPSCPLLGSLATISPQSEAGKAQSLHHG
jgi:hypothetical protein